MGFLLIFSALIICRVILIRAFGCNPHRKELVGILASDRGFFEYLFQ